MSDAAVYVSSSVAAVRELWDRSGLLAGPVIAAQLSQFAEALVDAHAASERAAAVLVGNGSDRSAKVHVYGGTFDPVTMLKPSAHPHAAGVSAEIEQVLTTG